MYVRVRVRVRVLLTVRYAQWTTMIIGALPTVVMGGGKALPAGVQGLN